MANVVYSIDDGIGVYALHTVLSDGVFHFFHLAYVVAHIVYFYSAIHLLVSVIIDQRLMPECGY